VGVNVLGIIFSRALGSTGVDDLPFCATNFLSRRFRSDSAISAFRTASMFAFRFRSFTLASKSTGSSLSARASQHHLPVSHQSRSLQRNLADVEPKFAVSSTSTESPCSARYPSGPAAGSSSPTWPSRQNTKFRSLPRSLKMRTSVMGCDRSFCMCTCFFSRTCFVGIFTPSTLYTLASRSYSFCKEVP